MGHGSSKLVWAFAALTLMGFPSAAPAAHVGTYTAPMATGDWKPTEDDLVNALDTLKHDASAWERRIGRNLRAFREYRFQYYGLREKGRRIVYLNAFCSAFWDAAPGWRESLVTVMDGGNCFFQAKVAADTLELIALDVNGEA